MMMTLSLWLTLAIMLCGLGILDDGVAWLRWFIRFVTDVLEVQIGGVEGGWLLLLLFLLGAVVFLWWFVLLLEDERLNLKHISLRVVEQFFIDVWLFLARLLVVSWLLQWSILKTLLGNSVLGTLFETFGDGNADNIGWCISWLLWSAKEIVWD